MRLSFTCSRYTYSIKQRKKRDAGPGEDVPPVVSSVGDPCEGRHHGEGDAEELDCWHQEDGAVAPVECALLEVPLLTML